MSYFVIFSYVLQFLFLMCLSSYLPNLRDLFTLNAPAASYIIYESIFEIYDFKTQENPGNKLFPGYASLLQYCLELSLGELRTIENKGFPALHGVTTELQFTF